MASRLLNKTAGSLIKPSFSPTSKGLLCASGRNYHSKDRPPAPGPFGDIEATILASAYNHVPEHGFSQRALALGARDAGYLDISTSVLVDGPFSLIRYHLAGQRQRMAVRRNELIDPSVQPSMAVKVGELTWDRLMGNKDIVHKWQEALAIMAHPAYLPTSLEELGTLSDEIWFLAGDDEVGPPWYAKRASLSVVYSSSELFMTNDNSPGFTETRKFLYRRLDEMEAFGGTLGALRQWAGFTLYTGINVLRSKAVPV